MAAAIPFLVALHAPHARAGWPADPAVNVAVCDTTVDEEFRELIADNDGGLFVGWVQIGPERYNYRVLRLDASGDISPGWSPRGILACPGFSYGSRTRRILLSSGPDAVLTCWSEFPIPRMRVQRVDSTGTPTWSPGGALVSTRVPYDFYAGVAMPDGGVMLFWRPWDGFNTDTLFAMRIDGNGQRAWSEDKVVNDSPGLQIQLVATMVSDSEVIAIWRDSRTTPNPGFGEPRVFELYGQKLDLSGAEYWAHNGVRLRSGGECDLVAPNGRGGVAGCVIDGSVDPTGDLFLMNLDRDGDPLAGWPAGGIPLGTDPQAAELPAAISVSPADGSVMTTWWDWENRGPDIFVQKVDTTGALAWPVPRVVFHATSLPAGYSACGDAQGGLFVNLQGPAGSASDIRAQHVLADGTFQWPPQGVSVTTAPGAQVSAASTPDSSGGVFYCWQDYRSGTNQSDLYAQHVNPDGSLGGMVVATEAAAISAELEAGCARVTWFASEAAGVPFTIERQAGDGEWAAVGQAFVDGTGRLEYRDCDVQAGERYAWRLRWMVDGATRHTVPIALMIAPGPTLSLAPPAPNPVSDRASIEYTLPARGPVHVTVLDVTGRLVATLAEGVQEAGVHRFAWRARDGRGRALPAGSYVLRLQTATAVQSRRLIIAR